MVAAAWCQGTGMHAMHAVHRVEQRLFDLVFYDYRQSPNLLLGSLDARNTLSTGSSHSVLPKPLSAARNDLCPSASRQPSCRVLLVGTCPCRIGLYDRECGTRLTGHNTTAKPISQPGWKDLRLVFCCQCRTLPSTKPALHDSHEATAPPD